MADPLADLLLGVDQARPLPSDVRERLLAAMLATDGEDTQRTLPESAEQRIEAALLTASGSLPPGLDGPRALPPAMRVRLERALVGTAGSRSAAARRRAVPAAAAVVVLLVIATVTALTRGAPTRHLADPPPPPSSPGPTESADAPPVPTPSASASPGSGTTSPRAPQARTSAGPRAGTGSVGGSRGAGRGSPPPFSGEAAPAPAAAPGCGECGPAAPPAPASSQPDIVLGVLRGDGDVEAGLSAYLAELADAGGIGGRRVRTVAASASAPAAGTVATVNLAAGALDGWGGGVLLEGLTVAESRLRGDTFSVASPVERQAHLAADAAFPTTSAGDTAVIFVAELEPWSQRVPAAYESVLRAKGVAVTRVVFRSSAPVLPPADAAFLSLPPAQTATWLAAAGSTYGSRVYAQFTLHDEALAGAAPDGAHALSPYQLPSGSELAALRARIQRPLSARVLHGWATAKHLAVALWRSGAASPAELAQALRQMAGYDGRVAPPYEVRPGTTSRTPEAKLHELVNGAFVPRGAFRRDTY